MFLFSWLFSLVFWAGYFGLSLFVGTWILKLKFGDIFRYITEGETPWYDTKAAAVFIATLVYIFWPIVLTYYATIFIFRKIVGPALSKLISSVASIIPNIEIKE